MRKGDDSKIADDSETAEESETADEESETTDESKTADEESESEEVFTFLMQLTWQVGRIQLSFRCCSCIKIDGHS